MEPKAIIHNHLAHIQFNCRSCQRELLAAFHDIGGRFTCPGCRQEHSIPTLPCHYSAGCDGVYARCEGKLITSQVGGSVVESPDWETRCERCGDVLYYREKAARCSRVVCNRCLRPYPG